MRSTFLLSLIILLTILLAACGGEDAYFPKPRLYPKVNYPAKSYVAFDEDYCSFGFERPVYSEVKQDKYFFEGKPLDPCWFDLKMDTLNSVVHFSYLPIKNRSHFDELIKDAFRLVNEHNKKAEYRQDQKIANDKGTGGMLFEVDGPVATPLQFFLTDSTRHFLRGSLYFNAKVNPDSIAPIYEFIKEDIYHILSTFEWSE